MGSIFFTPGYCEKIDIWHLKRKDSEDPSLVTYNSWPWEWRVVEGLEFLIKKMVCSINREKCGFNEDSTAAKAQTSSFTAAFSKVRNRDENWKLGSFPSCRDPVQTPIDLQE